MKRSLDTRIAALGLAAMLTLVMFSSLNLLATQPQAFERQLLADKAAVMQVIVVEAKRTTKS